MIEDDIATLDRGASKRPLDRLEADIWRGVEARLEQKRAARTVLSCQVVVLAVALFSSVAVGQRIAMNVAPRSVPSVLSIATEFSPSSRLMGY
jgi:hypothetical protein